MKDKNKKKSVTNILSLAGLFLAVSFSAVAGVTSILADVEIIKLPAKDFSAKNNDNYTFDCFIIEDDDDENIHTISVAWGQDPATVIDSELNVPDTFTNSETGQTYDVVGIANAGFRYCTFPKISLPSTVRSIGAEAFAYCTNMTEITIPYHVTEIKPSTFLDCRALANVYYAVEDSRTAKALFNYNISQIGDHAFDSCVSLASFNCPRTAVYFGESCFQNCASFTSFSFPRERKQNDVITNYITVKSFAFNDCTSLNHIYFETNMKYIYNYAFTDCAEDLTIDYTGNSLTQFDTFAPHWRRRYIATSRNNSSSVDGPTGHLIKVNLSQTAIREDDRYPGLHYSIMKYTSLQNYLLDCNVGNATATDVVMIQGPIEFAVIDGFTAPSVTKPGYYDVSSHSLIIPDKVVDPDDEDNPNKEYPVLAIGRRAFVNKTELEAVSFNESLIQIRREAFLGCSSISSLDFMNCHHLREISHKAFQDCTPLTAINLPYCLEYIGDYAFNNCYCVSQLTFSANDTLFIKDAEKGWIPVSGTFLRGTTAPNNGDGDNGDYYIDTVKYKAYKKANDAWSLLAGQKFGQTDPTGGNNGDYYVAIPRLKVIGERAFHKIGYTSFCGQNGTVNLILPESLNDKAARDAYYKHELRQGTDWEVTGGRTDYREIAVGRHAFDRAVCLATVEMAEAIDWDGTGTVNDHQTNSATLDYTCSIGTSAFARCYNLLRFQVSDNFYTIGASCFNSKKDDITISGTKYTYNYYRLKEVFLKSEKANNGSSIFKYPFAVGNHNLAGSNGDPLAVGTELKDLVFYIKGSVPKDLDDYSDYSSNPGTDQEPKNKNHWNAENAGYANRYESTSTRKHIPTYFDVDWQSSDGLLYWKPGLANNNSADQFASKPQSASDYLDNRVALVKQGNKYVVSRYYCNSIEVGTSTTYNDYDYIDLSSIPSVNCTYPATINAGAISSNIETIGMCAFAAKDDKSHGHYFVLPSTVKYIEERAFYCYDTPGNYGVRIVTYRDSKIYKKDGTQYANDAAFKNDCKNSNGYCYLPDGLLTIGRDAFHNNIFKSIRIGANLVATEDDPIPFGTTPFVIHNANSYTTTISFGSTSLDMEARTDSGSWVEVPCHKGTVASAAPASPVVGQQYYNSSSKKVFVYANSAWTEVAGAKGDYFINTANHELYYNDGSWAKTTPNNSGTTAPTSVTGTPGQNYLDTATDTLYVKSNGCALYYDDTSNSGANKTLVYQAGGNTNLLQIENGTTVIGKQSVARSAYISVNIPSSVTTLYGGCFVDNKSLRYVLGGAGIQYINASQSPEKWNSSMPFDMIDDTTSTIGSTYTGAFSGCDKLRYIDFTQMTNLKKIGTNAFNNCKVLSDMTGGKRYSYYKYTSDKTLDPDTKDENRNDGVLDLSYCTSLTNIYGSAFLSCASLKYIHTPKTSPIGSESKLTITKDAFKSTSGIYLVGETASQADYTLVDSDGGLNTSTHYPSGCFHDNGKVYFRVDSAVITLENADTSDTSKGRDGDFMINVVSDVQTVYEKRNGSWVALTNSELVESTTSNPGTTDNHNIGEYWLNTSTHVLFKKVAASKWQVVGDIPMDELDPNVGCKRNYWAYDSTNDRYILFPKGNKGQDLARMYFYYGVVS